MPGSPFLLRRVENILPQNFEIPRRKNNIPWRNFEILPQKMEKMPEMKSETAIAAISCARQGKKSAKPLLFQAAYRKFATHTDLKIHGGNLQDAAARALALPPAGGGTGAISYTKPKKPGRCSE